MTRPREWAAVVVTGAHNAEALVQLAAILATQMDEQRRRARVVVERG